MSREGAFENMGSTCFSSWKIFQELGVLLGSAEKVRFEVPTVETFWQLVLICFLMVDGKKLTFSTAHG